MQLSKEITEFHINAGKQTKMGLVDFAGILCSNKGMIAKDKGNINIIDISTFVKILNNKGETVFRELQKNY